MSFRFAAVPPTCLSSRLARTRPHLCSLQRHALVANQSSITVAPHRETIEDRSSDNAHKRNVRPHGFEPPDGIHNDRASVSVTFTDITRSQQRAEDEKGSVLLPQVHHLQTRTKVAEEKAGEELKDHKKTSWPDDWDLIWQRLHAELLSIRSLRTKNVGEIWSDHREFAKSFVGQLDDSGLQEKWSTLTKNEKGMILPRLLAGSLVESAARTLLVLDSVDIQPAFDFRIRMQCLRHIHFLYIHELYSGSEARWRFEGEIALLRNVERWPKHGISVPQLDTLLRWSDPEQCNVIIEAYQELYPHAQPEWLLPVVISHIKHGDVEAAFERFKQLPGDMQQETIGFVGRLRDLLLKHDIVTKTEMGSNFKILPQMLALGIQPDASLHNAVIEAALANEVPDVAWDLYYHLKNSEAEINARTHLVLLKDAFQRGQVEGINNVMTSIHEDENLVKDRFLIAYSMNIVRVICFFQRKAPPEESLSHIMALYDRAYNRAPLYRLGILNEINRTEENDLLPTPSAGALAFTIWSYILVQHSTEVVDVLWGWMRQLISKKEEDVIAVARLEIVYNALILFYARTQQGMVKAMQVLQYMLRSNLCRPSERTWSMLLCGFLRYHKFGEAKAILIMMRVRGVMLRQLSNEHIGSHNSMLKAMAADIEAMDGPAMPAELAHVMAKSSSLNPSVYAPEAPPAAATWLDLPTVWKGFADMHPSSELGQTSANIDNWWIVK